MRTIVIGDIHGCLEEFDELLKLVEVESGDRLISLGDLVDRGPDSRGMVRRAQELRIEVIRGNHEKKWLNRHKKDATVNPYEFSDDDWKFLEATPFYIEFADPFEKKPWVAVHAGVKTGIALADQDTDFLIYARYVDPTTNKMVPLKSRKVDDQIIWTRPATARPWTDVWTGPQSVIYGHQQSFEIRFADCKNGVVCLGIDTACCFGGRLTAQVFHSGRPAELISVAARRAYASLHGEVSE